MREIRIEAPRVDGDAVHFAWSVDPSTPLYRRTAFALRFPAPIDPAAIPERVWWTIALLCLHPHWALLRPCRVTLPVRLGRGEAEFWSRLVDASVATLEAHRGGGDVDRAIEIIESGEPLATAAPLPELGRCAAAFSGGKDSLLQAGLLCELAKDVLLVTTTSPMPPLHDHDTLRRRQVLRDVVLRRPSATLVEVHTDFRSSWKNDFPPDVGYQVAVNELTDTFLYLSSVIAAAWSHGATHLFLASEGEVQENVEIEGRLVQHPHAMYSAVTQSALSALLAPLGMRHSSAIAPLRSHQVQQLLWKRYGDLADLQYSCWRVEESEATCSSCSQCLRIAFAALSSGELPARMGIDLVKLMKSMHAWEPRLQESALPGPRVARELHLQTARMIAVTPLRHFMRATGTFAFATLSRFLSLRRRMRHHATGNAPGWRPAYLAHVDPLLRDRIDSIYREAFSAEDAREMFERGRKLTEWITATC